MARRGFTLIELLVVISIIALLIGILLPSLGAARETARNAKCLVNVRSLMLATAAYATDNGEYPPGRDKFSSTSGDQNFLFATLMESGQLPAEFSPSVPSADSGLRCPSGTLEVGNWINTTPYDPDGDKVIEFENRGGSFWSHYAPNAATANLASRRVPFRGDDGQIGNRVVVKQDLIDSSGEAPTRLMGFFDGGGYPQAIENARIQARHGGRTTTNISFFDGHAAAHQRDSLPSVSDGSALVNNTTGPYFRMMK